MGDWVMVVAVVAERISAYSFSLLALDIDTVKVTVVAEREQFLCDKEKAAGEEQLICRELGNSERGLMKLKQRPFETQIFQFFFFLIHRCSCAFIV